MNNLNERKMETRKACHNANHICDKNQYKEATLWEKIKLNFHLIYCRACRKYSSRNMKLTKVINNPEVKTVSAQEKDVLKARIQEQLNAKG